MRLSNNSWEIRTVTSTANNALSTAIAANAASGMLLVAAAGNGVDDRPLDEPTQDVNREFASQ